jgi:membrane-anchored mycosin MYCP
MPPEVNPPGHQRDELVVDLQHLDVVESMLFDLGVRHADLVPDDRDDLLGLARLRELTDADKQSLEVGEILGLLRHKATAGRDGWEPVIGKNRDVEPVIGLGHKPMQVVEPEPADAAEIPQALASDADAGRGVRVGMVDTQAADPGTTPLPFRAGHAEFVSSLIRRQAPAAEIHVERVVNPATGRGRSWDVARAMLRLAATQRVDILNLSLGCYTLAGGPPLVIARAIERLGPEVLVVAAAGNHGGLPHLKAGRHRRSACWPAAIPDTVAVGSVDGNGNISTWSPALPWVTCSALGEDVVGSYLTGDVELRDGIRGFTGHARWSGTSFSAATVTGAIAARTKPGSVRPRQALADLLKEGTLVRPF